MPTAATRRLVEDVDVVVTAEASVPLGRIVLARRAPLPVLDRSTPSA